MRPATVATTSPPRSPSGVRNCMAKHRKSFDDNAETHVLAEIVEESTGGDKGESSPVNSSGPFSLRSHDYTPLYSGGADPHATDVINIPNEPLVAERDPESPSSNRPA